MSERQITELIRLFGNYIMSADYTTSMAAMFGRQNIHIHYSYSYVIWFPVWYTNYNKAYNDSCRNSMPRKGVARKFHHYQILNNSSRSVCHVTNPSGILHIVKQIWTVKHINDYEINE